MKKRSIGLLLAVSALVTLVPGAAQAAKKDSCPEGGWLIRPGSALLGVDRVGDRPLDPDAHYCATVNPGQTTLDPLHEVWVVGPEVILADI